MKKMLLIIMGLCLCVGFLNRPAMASDYIIGDGDGLQVSVWGVPELTVAVTVRPDGKITLPAVGDVVAAGLTPEGLTDHLRKVLRGLVKTPVVTVAVTQITNNRIYVAGGGVPSAVVNLPGPVSLFKFLCGVGNLENVDLRRAYVLRNGKKVASDFYALFWDGDFSKDIELKANDILFLPTNELNKVYVLGAVNKPKYVAYRKGMKVLDAILDAEGFNQYASKNDVFILRHNGEKIKVKVKDLLSGENLKQNVSLDPGDYVVVGEGLF